ncbi:hypothetical protein SAMN04489761_3474 [Tenacibaculum sp. MAR_2009_124]|uniref:hypothetical protein n=1 Tax=Tenacibaculum sp. MAR_2009_124 TaxID=1250059 RepID=UPI00089D6817|nr:hypothetical protein [Tenacibaculum sp. MAR_2009_124]SEC67723.1 hypothetical protein SAMN04489761_3474 [Tenacibaculum sp. MAR_2009_124]
MDKTNQNNIPMSLILSQNNVRIDKNLAFNITDFRKYSKKDEALIKSLVIYMSLNFQKNLFGLVDIDPADFAKRMKIYRTDLFKKHDDPLFFKVSSTPKEELLRLEKEHGNMSQYRCWNTNLENALFVLKYENIISSYKSKSGDEERITLNNFAYIKELHLVFKKVGKTKKIIYQYKPTEEFEFSLRKFFFNANITTFLALRSSSLEDWYLNLLNRIQVQQYTGNTKPIYYKIVDFAKLLNISTQRLEANEKDAFSDVKKKINRKFKKTFLPKVEKEIMGLELNWRKSENSKYYNVVEISWIKPSEESLKENKKSIYEDLFLTELFKNLSVFYNENYLSLESDMETKTNKFLKWLFSYNDLDIKKGKYISVFADIKGKHSKLEEKAHDYFVFLGDMQNKRRFLRYEESEFILINPMTNQELHYKEIKEAIKDMFDNKKVFYNYD